ncbi:acyltransferase [Escherichia coli]|uniref:acyltransferase n=1 Tax=Escherichia coli TaxID=562 RepID=UPI001F154AE3|nr:acyltransferase family protein [Escherichia coli]
MDEKVINIRAVAAIMVVVLHVNSQYFHDVTNYWTVFALIGSAMRPCVPIFIMISGYLLIGRVGSSIDFMKRRISRLLPPILFWGVFYVFFVSVVGNAQVSINSLISILIDPPMFHLWYLYLIVGVYLMMPILSSWYLSASFGDKIFYISLWFACLLVAQFGLGVEIINRYYLGQFSTYSFYLIVGAFVKEVSFKCNVRWSVPSMVYILITLLITTLTIYDCYNNGAPSEKYYEYTNPMVVLQSIFLFMALIKLNKSNWFTKVVSNYSLGVYCVHVAIILLIFPTIKTTIDNAFISYFASISLVLISSVIISSIIRLVPFIKSAS